MIASSRPKLCRNQTVAGSLLSGWGMVVAEYRSLTDCQCNPWGGQNNHNLCVVPRGFPRWLCSGHGYGIPSVIILVLPQTLKPYYLGSHYFEPQVREGSCHQACLRPAAAKVSQGDSLSLDPIDLSKER